MVSFYLHISKERLQGVFGLWIKWMHQLLVVVENQEEKRVLDITALVTHLNVSVVCLTLNITSFISTSLSALHTSFQQCKMKISSPPVSFSVLLTSMLGYPILEIVFFLALVSPNRTLSLLAMFPAWEPRDASMWWAFLCPDTPEPPKAFSKDP